MPHERKNRPPKGRRKIGSGKRKAKKNKKNPKKLESRGYPVVRLRLSGKAKEEDSSPVPLLLALIFGEQTTSPYISQLACSSTCTALTGS